MSWDAVATHGQTEEEVRAALQERMDEGINDLRRQLRAEGISLAAIEQAVELVKQRNAQHLDERLPVIMKNMELSAGAAQEH